MVANLKPVVDMISPLRAKYYDEWYKALLIFKNLPSEQNGEDLFKQFSMKCPERYDEIENEKAWLKAKPNGALKPSTLLYWAKQDNPKEYKKIFKTGNRETSLAIAQLLYDYYGGQFIYHYKKQCFYFFTILG